VPLIKGRNYDFQTGRGLAKRGFGIAFLPPFAVSSQIERGTLVPLLEEHIQQTGELAALWPT
jgi:DNA-binding transcriptional LysR family regulator